MDNTADLARVLRVPETKNFKDKENPKEVRFIEFPDNPPRYTVEQLPQYNAVTGGKKADSATDTGGLTEGDINIIVKRCLFIRHCAIKSPILREPEWHAAINNLALVNKSDDIIHLISRPHPKYTQEETQDRINRAREEKKPHTCQYIRDELGFKGCPAGGCPVEAPIGWLSSKRGVAYDKVWKLLGKEKLTRRDVWDGTIQDAFAEIKLYRETDYLELLQRVHEKVPALGIRDLRKSIDSRCRRKMQQHPQDNNEVLAELSKQLGYDVVLPDGYYFDERGQLIHQSNTRIEVVAMQPVGIAGQYVSDTGEKLDSLVFLCYEQEKRWRQLLVQPQSLASYFRIIDLANYGILVDSTNASQLVGFLTRFKRANGDRIKAIRFTSQLGWQEDGTFFPGLSEYRFIRQRNTFDETESFAPKGTLKEWTDLASTARQSPGARLAMIASFAAPLVKLTNQRTHIIHIWGNSRGGKTAAQILAASVWMSPRKAMISFNTTKVGLERQLGFFSNVPVIVNERQAAGDNQQLLDMLIYMIGEGKGKTRGTRVGTVLHGEEWDTICLTSGEHPLSSQSSAAGAKTRSLEPFFERVLDDQYAGRLHVECQQTYGTAGPLFLAKVMENRDILTAALASWSDYIKNKYEAVNAVHRSYLALAAATDYLVSTLIWNMKEADAKAETENFVDLWKQAIDVTGETEEIHRVRAFVEGWLAQNERHFSKPYEQDLMVDRYGWYLEDGNIGIVPLVLQKALAANGFNWDRVKIDFAKPGWLKTCIDRGHISYTTTRTISGQGSVRLVELIGFRKEEPETPEPAETQGLITCFEEDGRLLA